MNPSQVLFHNQMSTDEMLCVMAAVHEYIKLSYEYL